jgi:hypothetical protein
MTSTLLIAFSTHNDHEKLSASNHSMPKSEEWIVWTAETPTRLFDPNAVIEICVVHGQQHQKDSIQSKSDFSFVPESRDSSFNFRKSPRFAHACSQTWHALSQNWSVMSHSGLWQFSPWINGHRTGEEGILSMKTVQDTDHRNEQRKRQLAREKCDRGGLFDSSFRHKRIVSWKLRLHTPVLHQLIQFCILFFAVWICFLFLCWCSRLSYARDRAGRVSRVGRSGPIIALCWIPKTIVRLTSPTR